MTNTEWKAMFPYAVVTTYTFDNEVNVHPCAGEDEAKALLKHFYETEVAQDTANGWNFTSEISDDGWRAKITDYPLSGGEDVTEFRIGSIDSCGKEVLNKVRNNKKEDK